MKRAFAVLLTGVLALGLLSGCGTQNKTSAGADSTASSDESGEAEVITMMINGSASDAPA